MTTTATTSTTAITAAAAAAATTTTSTQLRLSSKLNTLELTLNEPIIVYRAPLTAGFILFVSTCVLLLLLLLLLPFFPLIVVRVSRDSHNKRSRPRLRARIQKMPTTTGR